MTDPTTERLIAELEAAWPAWVGAVYLLNAVEPDVPLGPDAIRRRLQRLVDDGRVERMVVSAVRHVHSGRPEYRLRRESS